MKNVIENESVFIFKLRNCRHRTAQIRRLITAIDVLCQLFRLFFTTMLHRITLKCLYFAIGTGQNRKKKTHFNLSYACFFQTPPRYVRRRVSAGPRAVQLENLLSLN